MASTRSVLLLILAVVITAAAHEMPFENTALVVVEQGRAKERAVALIFDDLDFTLRDRRDRNLVLHKIQYQAVSKFAYEFAEQPKFLADGPPSSGKPRHWLAIYYEDNGAPATMTLILDEYEYKNILTVCKIIAEKEVEGAPTEE
jgi:hypothetical protein